MLKRIGVALAAIALVLPLQVFGAEERAVILSFLAIIVDNSLTHHIQAKSHVDTLAQIVGSEEIDCCQTEQ